MWKVACAIVIAVLATAAAVHEAYAAAGPMDGLTAQEYWTALDTLRASGHVTQDATYPYITLQEPPKADVLEWTPGAKFLREALVVVRQDSKTYEAVVDVGEGKVVSWTLVPGAMPNLTASDQVAANAGVHENADWLAAIKRRGISNPADVNCNGAEPGYYGSPAENDRRLLIMSCYLVHGAYEPDARLIVGIVVEWDLDAQQVVSVIDTGGPPVPTTADDYDAGSIASHREPLHPYVVSQPLGASFRVDGNDVAWQNWRFHFRIDRRTGLVVTNVGYDDGGKVRSILYEGTLSEIFVPYMDLSEDWYWAAYFDLGAFADGFASPLEPGADCPDDAQYFDQVYAGDNGMPVIAHHAACLFERENGDPAWRHAGNNPIESRPTRDLVLRTIGNFSNYDYVFDWVFRQDGTIEIKVGLTGIDEMAPTASSDASAPGAAAESAHGRFVAQHLVAPFHDHYFSFRLNFAIDGTANSFVRDRLVPERITSSTPRKTLWVDRTEIAKTESDAQLSADPEHPEVWRVINPNVRNALGDPVGYEIEPGADVSQLLPAGDYPQSRAGFTAHQLWVTPYSADERFAAGEFPVQSSAGNGLPAWTKANRSIENTDLVVWYTLGIHHLPSAEDFPVMPTRWVGFSLRPFDFFSRDPAIDLPR